MTVDELLRRISSPELTEWAAYFAIEAEDHEREMAKIRARSGR